MDQQIADWINPLPELAAEVNESFEVPTNQYTSNAEKAWKLIKTNKNKLIVGVVAVLVTFLD